LGHFRLEKKGFSGPHACSSVGLSVGRRMRKNSQMVNKSIAFDFYSGSGQDSENQNPGILGYGWWAIEDLNL
jgi:hypothetical protein